MRVLSSRLPALTSGTVTRTHSRHQCPRWFCQFPAPLPRLALAVVLEQNNSTKAWLLGEKSTQVQRGLGFSFLFFFFFFLLGCWL